MKFYLSIVFILVGALSFSNAWAINEEDACTGSTVYFGNGVDTTPLESELSRDILTKKIDAELQGTDYENSVSYATAYNPTFGLYFDLIEALIQLDQSEQGGNPNDDNRNYGLYWGFISGLPTYLGARFLGKNFRDRAFVDANPLNKSPQLTLVEQHLASIEAVNATANLSNVTVASHAQQYRKSLEQGDKVIVVAHSQGNFFANLAYQKLGMDTNDLIQGMGIVPVATPDEYVAGGTPDDVIEHSEDLVTGFFGLDEEPSRDNFPGIEETFEHLDYDFTGHGFIKSYLAAPVNHQSERLILDSIINKLTNLPAPNPMAKPKCPGIVVDAPTGPAALEATPTNRLNSNIYLTDSQNRQFGRLDWKGRYSGGFPTKVLTYFGPRARVIGSDFAPFILRHGRQSFTAPGPVHGAAVTIDSLGREWLVAIVNSEGGVQDFPTAGGDRTDLVYIRPNTDAPDFSDALVSVDNPNGWRLIAQFPMEQGSQIYSPWFFNGDGTEAQTMRLVERSHYFSGRGEIEDVFVLQRQRISLDSIVTASIENFPYEIGETSTVAVDYLDDEVLLLKTVYTPFNQLPVWLTVNDEELIPRVQIGDELKIEDFDCVVIGDIPCGFGSVDFSPNWDGFRISWGNLGDEASEVVINLTYLDLRSRTLLMSRFEAPINNQILANNGTVTYRIVHDDEISVRKEFGDSDPQFNNISDGWMLGGAEPIPNSATGEAEIGFYKAATEFIRNGPITIGERTVGPYNDFIVSERFPDGSTFNYYTEGSISDLVGTSLEGVTFDVGLK